MPGRLWPDHDTMSVYGVVRLLLLMMMLMEHLYAL